MRAAVSGVVREAIIAACLTAAMILLFLGSWRSTIIIAVSIPLSILVSICVLSALGETINIMTLGGLALAVGILVDDATVEIENIHRNLVHIPEVVPAILEGARQIAVPALVSTLCICIVFLPMFFLTGVARYLFIPLAEAVVFAMLASYLLSRTLVPTLAMYLLKPHGHEEHAPAAWNFPARMQLAFESMPRPDARFVSAECWPSASAHRERVHPVISGRLCAAVVSAGALAGAGFLSRPPTRDASICTCAPRRRRALRKPRAPAREWRPPFDASFPPTRSPASSITSVFRTAPSICRTALRRRSGPWTPIFWSPSPNAIARPTITCASCASACRANFPACMFYFTPADIVTQILNFGLARADRYSSRQPGFGGEPASSPTNLLDQLKSVPGTTDLHVHQPFDQPKIHINVDRTKAAESGFTQYDVANSTLVSLSGSFQTTPEFWLDPRNGVSYSVVTQAPQYTLTSLSDLRNIPITSSSPTPQRSRAGDSGRRRHHQPRRGAGGGLALQHPARHRHFRLGAGSRSGRGGSRHHQDRRRESQESAARHDGHRSAGNTKPCRSSFTGLLGGLALAIVLVYALIVVNFQSWLDPFIIITALPAALAGIVLFLFATHTTISVPALMGSIMSVGVATSNSILVVSFAKERLDGRGDAEAGGARCGLRPVPSGADDGAGDDHRHGADGARPGRRRRAERAAGTRGDRRPDFRDSCYAILCTHCFQPDAPAPPG